MQEYKPISCDYYDYIEQYAMKAEPVIVEYMDQDSMIRSMEDVIVDTRVSNGEEFIQLKSGKEIRMDHIIRLNDHILSDFKAC